MFSSPLIITATPNAGYRPANSERHYCRNPRCRSKLPTPVDNPHKAFCSKGCYGSFYLKRCVVCENEKPAGSTIRRIHCQRPKCESSYRQNRGLYSFPGTIRAANGSRNSIKSSIKSGVTTDRPWRIAAGPTLSPSAFHYAVLPLDRRTAADNARHNKQYYRDAVIKTLIGPTDLPINKIPGLTRPRSPIDRAALSDLPISADLTIPDFLRRTRATP